MLKYFKQSEELEQELISSKQALLQLNEDAQLKDQSIQSLQSEINDLREVNFSLQSKLTDYKVQTEISCISTLFNRSQLG